MQDIQNTCVFIYFPISFFFITWSGGWMTKALDCGQRGEGSKFTLDMPLAWWSIASFNKLSIVSLKMKLGIRVMNLMRMCFGFVHNSIHKKYWKFERYYYYCKMYLYNNLLFEFF
jgi:hypothetical protein